MFSKSQLGIDWNEFIEDAQKYGLYEAICGVQMGIITTPQPSELEYLRYPYAFFGPVCLGFSLYGRSCLPTSTVVIDQEVDKLVFMEDGKYHSIATETVKLPLATSCVEKCELDSSHCTAYQTFDASSCQCR